MKHTYRKLLGLLLTLTLILALAVPAFAAGTDAGRGLVKYLKYDPSVGGFVEDEANCIEITARTNVLLSGRWYVVRGEITMNGSMFLDGEANLVLADGGKLTVTEGILVREDSALNIFAQSEGTGELYVTPAYMGAGIGGASGENAGDVTIHGGKVTAYGGWLGAGIGGADQGDSGNVTINGGIVTAYGGEDGAGIGGGCESYDGTVTINGGTVTAYGGEDGAGIGGGDDSSGTGVTINGGTVTAVAGESADGIGGGHFGEAGTLTVGDGVEIKGGDNEASQSVLEAPYSRRYQYMTAVGPEPPVYARVSYQKYDLDAEGFVEDQANAIVIDESSTALSAGWYVAKGEITVADRIQVSGAVNLILADGAKLNAQKGIHVLDPDSLTIFGQTEGSGELIAVGEEMFAGIGMDNTIDPAIDPVEGKGGSLTVHGGKISATGGTSCAGIGGGYRGHGGKVTIYGGEVTATGGSPGAGIGGGYSGNGGVFTMYGGKVTARGGTVSAGIGGGQTGSAGEVTIYGGTIDTTAGNNGAGIGSGMNGRGGNVTIYDGNVTATGSSSGVAIGSGAMDTVGVTVKIYDGTVTANGNNSPGIGGGTSSRGFTVEIYGGTVVARGDNYGMAGIGGASGADGGTVRIFGGDVSAYGSQFSSGIGGGVSSTGGTVEISGGKVLAVSPSGGAGIGTGIVGQFNGVTITGGDVTAIGGSYGSGDNIRYAQGIGRGAAAGTSTVIPLTVGENMAVLGGADAGSLELLEAPYNDRPVYMTVKEKPIDASFVWDLEGDVPAATLVLEWANGNTTQIPATVTYSEAQGVGTFTAVAEADGVTYTDEKSVTLSYTVALTGGEITSGAKDSYAYGDSIIVTAGPAPEGKSFAGWYLDGVLVSTAEVYGRVIDRDLALEARFEDQPVEVKPTVVASSTPRVPVANSDNYKTSLSVSWSVPQGYALVEAGIYRAYAGSMPTAEKLITKGTKKVSTLKNANGVYKLNVTMGSNKNVYGLYYIGYVTYKNASGQTLTEYSEIGCDPAIVLIS